MRRTIVSAVLLSFVLLTTGVSTTLANVDQEAGDNGLVYMVHGHFEPAVTEPTPAPPGQEAFATTQQEGEILLSIIPYGVEEEAPIALADDAQLLLEGPLPDQAVTLDPREGTSEDARCVDETSLPGYEGDVEDCLVATVDAETVRAWGAVSITLSGTLASTDTFVEEAYSSPAHLALHTTMEEGEPGFATADQLSALTTPFLVEDLVDPVA